MRRSDGSEKRHPHEHTTRRRVSPCEARYSKGKPAATARRGTAAVRNSVGAGRALRHPAPCGGPTAARNGIHTNTRHDDASPPAKRVTRRGSQRQLRGAGQRRCGTAAVRAARFDVPPRAAVRRQRETASTRTHGTTTRFSLRSAFLEGEASGNCAARDSGGAEQRRCGPRASTSRPARRSDGSEKRHPHEHTARRGVSPCRRRFSAARPEASDARPDDHARRSAALRRSDGSEKRHPHEQTPRRRVSPRTSRFSRGEPVATARRGGSACNEQHECRGRPRPTGMPRKRRATRMPRPATPNRNAAKATSNTNAAAGHAQQECREERRATRMPRTRRAERMPGHRHPGTQSSPGSSRSTMCIARAASVMLEVSEGYTANTRATWSTVRRRSTAIAMG